MRIGYVLHECFKSRYSGYEPDEVIARELVDFDLDRAEEFVERTVPWAIEVLNTRKARFGLFEAQLTVLDEDGDPGRYLRHAYLVGCGEALSACQVSDPKHPIAEVLRRARADEEHELRDAG